MQSNAIQRRDDFGRHVRTQFELSEAGENNLVLDELQYQLDILFGKGATQQSKLLSLNNIVRIFTSNMPIGAQKLLRRGAEDLFTQISSCLVEQQLVPSVLALILAISCNNDGNLSPNISIPSDILPIFLACGKFEDNLQSTDANQLPTSFAAPIVTSVDESADNNKSYRKKRKFDSAVNQGDPPMVPLPLSEFVLVRHYGSKRSNTEDSQTAMSQISKTMSVSGSSQSDDYWTDDFFPVPQRDVVESVLKPAPPAESSAATAGGFHRKRKLGNGNGNNSININNNNNKTNNHASLPTASISVPVSHSTNDIVNGTTADATSLSAAAHSSFSERFHAIYSTFIATNNTDHTLYSSPLPNQCTHILHLILLNRYLSTRVQALATVKTDMFLSTNNTDPDTEQHSAESNAPTQHSNAVSNTESHDNNNGNYDSNYRAQTESLTQMQCAMREEAEEQAPFLGRLCEDVYAACAAVTTSRHNVNGNDSASLSLSTLWLSLGVLDSACFRCPQNQSYLANYTIWTSVHRHRSAHSTQDPTLESASASTSLPSTLSTFLQHATSQLLAQVLQQHHQEVAVRAWKHNNNNNNSSSTDNSYYMNRNHHSNNAINNSAQVSSPIGSIGKFGTPIVSSQSNTTFNNYRSPHVNSNVHNSGHASIPPSTGRSTATTNNNTTQPLLPVEWEKFRNLFPEIPVVLSTHTSKTTDEMEVLKDSAHSVGLNHSAKKRSTEKGSAEIDTIDSGGSQWEDDDPLDLFSQYSTHSSPTPVVAVSGSRLTSTLTAQNKHNTPVRSPLCTATAATSGASNSDTKTDAEKQGRLEGGKEVKAVVGLSEVCTAALKTLVSLSHDCLDTVQTLVKHNSNQIKQANQTQSATQSSSSSRQRSPLPSQLQFPVSDLYNETPNRKDDNSNNSHSMGTVQWAVAMLAWCAAWRCSLANSTASDSVKSGKGGKDKPSKGTGYRSAKGALSPDETALERFVFDLMLYLQSLLTNIAEFSASAVAATAVWPCLCAYDVFSYLPDAEAHRAGNVSYLAEKCPLLCHLLSHTASAPVRGASNRGHTISKLHALCVSDLLVEILHLEAIDFLVDLEETDAAINNQLQEQQQSVVQTSPLKIQRTTSSASATGSAARTGKVSDSSMPVPVAELIVSAHAALLLHTLTSSTSTSSPSSAPSDDYCSAPRIESGERNCPGKTGLSTQEVAQPLTEQESLSDHVRAKLPRGNWWLCVRVLKAFLTLQGQTGIMLLENLSPVLAAVQSMAKQDNPQPSTALVPAATGGGNTVSLNLNLKVASEHYNSPEIPKALLNPPASASASKKKHTHGQGHSQSQSAHKRSLVDLSTSDLPGKIDFLDLWAEEAPKVKRSAVPIETKPLRSTSSDLRSLQEPTTQKQEKGPREWVWDGRDYVWQSASLVSVVVPLRAAGGESLYKTSFRAREEPRTSSVSSTSTAAPAPVIAASVAAAEASVLTALSHTKLKGVRRFAEMNEEEEEGGERGMEQDEAEEESISHHKFSDGEKQKTAKATGAVVGVSRTALGSLDTSTALNDGNSLAVKESAGFRAKRKSFGAPQVRAQQAPPQDWLE